MIDNFYNEIRSILQTARNNAYSQVNNTMVTAYWQVGRRIVEQEQKGNEKADYGSYIIKNLSKELGNEFGKGFSIANLKNFRKFYLTYPQIEKSYALRSQLTWTHHRLIMRVDSAEARNYYLKECSKESWSTRVLERNIKSNYFSRLLSTQKGSNIEKENKNLSFLKDPYVLEFLGLPEDNSYKESQLEDSIITNIQKFLLEMGKGFSFVGRQYRISTETSHFYIDLVFYNYILKCFVVIDLKTEKLTHQDIGQMDMYVRLFDDLKRNEDDNPTIGLILCADKDETIVKYSVLKDSEQIFASRYKTVLPSEEELIKELEYETQLAKRQLEANNE